MNRSNLCLLCCFVMNHVQIGYILVGITVFLQHFCVNSLHSSDISVSKINLVSVTVLCVTGSFPFLLYFSFENLFRFSFSVFTLTNISLLHRQISYHSFFQRETWLQNFDAVFRNLNHKFRCGRGREMWRITKLFSFLAVTRNATFIIRRFLLIS